MRLLIRVYVTESNDIPETINGLVSSPNHSMDHGNEMDKPMVTQYMPVMFIAIQYPATRSIFEKWNIPWRDQRVPSWMTLIQSLAQNNIWFEDGFVNELRAALPLEDPLQQLDDLELVHVKTRDLSRYPAVCCLLDRYGVPYDETPVMPWEQLEQAAARKGIWPVDDLIRELNNAIETSEDLC